MKYSYRWLKELTGTKKSPEALAKLLIAHAFEVESTEKREAGLEGVIVGEVLGLEPHPNADKLRVAEVRLGKTEVATIVCGAPNIAVGQKVAVAVPGTLLPGGRRIEEATIRGVASNGMICSSKELGLDDSHEGILVLPDDVSPGTLFAKHFLLEDTLLEVKILPDRASDALSYQGLAREIAALDGYAPAFVKENLRPIAVPAYNRAPKIFVQDKKACRRYIGMLIKNTKVAASPLWLQIKLILSGIRPINNIVDATNYLMLLSGGPLHAFDADTLTGALSVRKAKKNEKLELLTGEIIKLDAEDLVIADEKQALALAGIMGGKKSAISSETKNVFLEIASFDPSTIRRSKTRHKLATDAAYRFERNVDPNLPKTLSRLAAKLVPALSGGKVMGLREVSSGNFRPWTIDLSLARVEQVLGLSIPIFAVVKYLALLELKVKKVANRAELRVTVDTRRPDLRDEWDLIEEIGRMHGYDKITPLAPQARLAPSVQEGSKVLERRLKETVASQGFDEIMTYSFYGKKELTLAGLELDRHVVLENPMNPDQEFLRVSLLPNLLRKTRENARYFRSFSLFEYGSVFETGAKALQEEKMLALGVALDAVDREGESFFALKGKIIALFEAMGWPVPTVERREALPAVYGSSLFHPTRSAVLVLHGAVVGIMGELHPMLQKKAGLGAGVAFAELRVSALPVGGSERQFAPLQKYPFALRDISLIFPAMVSVADAESFLAQAGGPLLQKFELFDIYEHDSEKKMAFHLYFGGADRTLTSGEMDAAFEGIVAQAKEKFGARLPGALN